MKELKGFMTSKGTAIGSAFLFTKIEVNQTKHKLDLESEKKRLLSAILAAEDNLNELISSLNKKLSNDELNIFKAQILMLKDPLLMEKINEYITNNNVNEAFILSINSIKEMFLLSNNDYIKERVNDLDDISELVLNILNDNTLINLKFNKPTILVADILTPSMTVKLDLNFVKGIITKRGSLTSHSAILAKHLGIPSIAGINLELINNDDTLILDANNDTVIINPNDDVKLKYEKLIDESIEASLKLKKYLNVKPYTKDNHLIELLVNISNEDDLNKGLEYGALGIGLYRTEHQFINENTTPNINNLYNNYEKILNTFKDKPVTIRLLDIGGDKPLPFINNNEELNPFLGRRGIRLLLEEKDLFKLQLKALFKANKHNNLKILLPMVSTLEELEDALLIINETFNEEKVKYPYYIMPKVGIMIEVLSAALSIDDLVTKIDFASIGTNDLIQYLFAADRTNDKVSNLYQPYHPVLLKLISNIVATMNKHNKDLSVCGEMASNLNQSLLLIGLGVKSLSMNHNQLLETKNILSKINLSDLKDLSEKALKEKYQEDVKKLIDNFLNKIK